MNTANVVSSLMPEDICHVATNQESGAPISRRSVKVIKSIVPVGGGRQVTLPSLAVYWPVRGRRSRAHGPDVLLRLPRHSAGHPGHQA
jgi:hypothetical protein